MPQTDPVATDPGPADTDLTGLPVFVTGATGFIGRALVRRLVAAGAQVTALSRGRHALPGVRMLRGDVRSGARLAPALAGQAVLFSLAYDVRQSGAANLAGFERLVAAAEAAKVGRIVHLSSIVVEDGWPDGAASPSPPTPGGSPYRQAKIAEEARLLSGALPAAILRPTLVWGPGSRLWTEGFAEALLGGGIALPMPDGLFQGVFVEDVVTACLQAACLPDLGRETFVVNGPAPVPWSDLLQGYARALGRGTIRRAPAASLDPGPEAPPPDRPALAARLGALGRAALGAHRFEALVRCARRAKGVGELRPDPHLFALMTSHGDFPSTAAHRRLCYAPAYGLAEGLAATAPALAALAKGRGTGAG